MAELEQQSLTDAEILRSVEFAVRRVLLPAIPEDEAWARAAGVQLIGLVRYALDRGEDQTASRIEELADLLTGLGMNELVAAAWDGDRSQRPVMRAVGDVLAAAVGRDDAAADQVRSVLRPVVIRQLDDELATTAPLVDAFRGRIDE